MAILAGLLLPSFSMGAAGSGRLAWVEVCTALGAKRVPVPAEWAGGDIVASGATNALAPGAPGDEPAPHPLEHCPWCTVGAHSALPAPPAPAVALTPPSHDAPVVREPDVAHPARPACSAQPRAPPPLA